VYDRGLRLLLNEAKSRKSGGEEIAPINRFHLQIPCHNVHVLA